MWPHRGFLHNSSSTGIGNNFASLLSTDISFKKMARSNVCVILCLIHLSLQGLVAADPVSHTVQLMKDRMVDYDKSIFPRCDSNDTSPILVQLDIAIRQILDLREQQQLLEASTWMRWSWEDCRLRGVVPEDNQTNFISVAANNLWMPDITLYEHVGDPLHTMNDYPAKVFSDGRVNYNFPAVIKVVCKIQMKNFPFDEQKCDLTLGSWMYLVNELNVTTKNEAGDKQYYVHNGEWDLIDFPAKRSEILYAGYDSPFVDVKFSLYLKRRPTYYIFNIIFPTFLVGLVSVLSFSLPPATGEKVSLSVTSLLTQTVFMLMLSQEMPSTSESIPLIQRYFAAILCIVSSSTIMTIFVLNIHYRGEYGCPVPACLKSILHNRYLRSFCQLPRTESKHDLYKTTSSSLREPEVASIYQNGDKCTSTPTSNGFHSHSNPTYTPPTYPGGTEPLGPQNNKQESVANKVNDLISQLTNKQSEKAKQRIIVKEWEDLASIVDRIFLIVCFTSLLVTTTVILFG